ncbi:glycosyltransferase family 4 protein [Fusobacterium sp.]|uniref:glycosyltransferase family 4 protein n=1 Tax=Fusobacterium sp. TaxID=68766 RepID=UPI0029001817|nr:glycosyltransferase family 4 protein [Fusobacterium sp.]MDU1912158.1 glycosyltransferase family 4 protein [Fusobacterium sp.]
MNKSVLFLTTKYSKDENNLWLTNELALEFLNNNFDVHVLALSWEKNDPKSSFGIENGISVLRIKLPNFIYKLGSIAKILFFQFYIIYSYICYMKKIKINYVISSTPAFIFFLFPFFLKKIFKTINYMILWDFYPYCLESTKILKNSAVKNLLKYLEKISFYSYDVFGCMSNGNIEFFKDKYPALSKKRKIEILPIWARDKEISFLTEKEKKEFRKKYDFNIDDFILIYGGAFSVIQELDKIVILAEKLVFEKNIKILMIGKGNEKERIKKDISTKKLKNIQIYDFVPREDYEKLVSICDMGIVCLDSKMKVPSFPSKTLDYFKLKIPILAMVDEITDYLKILKKENMGIGMNGFSQKKLEILVEELLGIVKNKEIKKQMGENGNKYYKKNLNVKNSFEIISKHF